MMHELKQYIVDILNHEYPDKTVVVESVPQNFKEGTFLIDFNNQDYEKMIGNVFSSKVLIDIAYWPESTESPRDECMGIQENLLRVLATNSTFRAQKLKAKIVDEILHITFSVGYRELKKTKGVLMWQQQINMKI